MKDRAKWMSDEGYKSGLYAKEKEGLGAKPEQQGSAFHAVLGALALAFLYLAAGTIGMGATMLLEVNLDPEFSGWVRSLSKLEIEVLHIVLGVISPVVVYVAVDTLLGGWMEVRNGWRTVYLALSALGRMVQAAYYPKKRLE